MAIFALFAHDGNLHYLRDGNVHYLRTMVICIICARWKCALFAHDGNLHNLRTRDRAQSSKGSLSLMKSR